MVAILGVKFISKHTHLKMMKNLLQEEDVKSCLLWTCWNVFSWIKLFKIHSFCVFVQSWKISVHSAALDYFLFKCAASESSSVTVLLWNINAWMYMLKINQDAKPLLSPLLRICCLSVIFSVFWGFKNRSYMCLDHFSFLSRCLQ